MYNIQRFIDAQTNIYKDVVKELRNEKKESHWVWFIFPQLKGLGFSEMSEYYGIENMDEAKEYVSNSRLWNRYLECCSILLSSEKKDIKEIMGYVDSLKLLSSLTLFYEVSKNEIISKLLSRYYGGKEDENTLKMLSVVL